MSIGTNPKNDFSAVMGRIRAIPEEWRELNRTPPELPVLLWWKGKPFLHRGIPGILVGQGGGGKTTLLTQLAVSIATGCPVAGITPEKPGRVALLLAEEDEGDIERKLHAIGQSGLPSVAEIPPENFFIGGLRGSHVSMMELNDRRVLKETEFSDALYSHLEALGPWDFIAIDPLVKWGGSECERDNFSGNAFIEIADRLCGLPGKPTVLIAAHNSKAARNATWQHKKNTPASPRGPSALSDEARWVASISFKPEKPFDVWFRIDKANALPPGIEVRLHRRPDNGIFEAAKEGVEWGDTEADDTPLIEAAIIEHLRIHGECAKTVLRDVYKDVRLDRRLPAILESMKSRQIISPRPTGKTGRVVKWKLVTKEGGDA